ncbi:hypothetical protein A6M27_17080 [Acidithiobacillus thiooxidans]|jgi:membrane-bound metal-dependent hydrolase YbcI (DUF457 family)|uniref:metal-dependent hydrolase n=1 Tax=Acidithiobacillus thiooxidans TaxID=930 RepID=UPI00046424B7|nr:metal-dependent hydrolase [Acidithiobacillus thiooxidans]OCX68474.1 hypothetical protein A6O24_19660 [Acidithiobacillus thiooxidans]OCX83464.1 hypothetical protein A6O26_06970 [Acidithiobacillus thiooxidans]OCX83808.1 hypothetical protein A6M27_17080 [Acidithiobacillus thiooxidans]OFC50294.1 hypothetical protein BAE47_03065 [Acidithiobacillus thiooxidans]
MTKTGHQLTGLGAALAAVGLIGGLYPGQNLIMIALLAFFGSSAPDWLEIPQGWQGRKRLSVIPHRTWTHWWPVWLGSTLFGLGILTATPHPFVLAFTLGAWLHLLMDIPNPMGLPLWHPERRVSLRLWKSSEHVMPLALGSWGLGFLVLILPGALQMAGLSL